ncbi:11498_t:CDS:2 [Dentiscutata heterogama]|uniref:11498_t:CDS:1 n=1 Tax=Dentiscutata heterogama TaxID=1316150 RepID=A0ACA9N420_9GLOM|nr:11498_t:CDS:2 [Dentiscutata heterogama]
MALERLAELECPIKWLANDLENLTNNDYCRNSTNIHDKLLSNEEFKVSIIVLIIKELVYRLNNTDSDFDIINKYNEFVEQTKIDKYLVLSEIKTTEKNDPVVW